MDKVPSRSKEYMLRSPKVLCWTLQFCSCFSDHTPWRYEKVSLHSGGKDRHQTIFSCQEHHILANTCFLHGSMSQVQGCH